MKSQHLHAAAHSFSWHQRKQVCMHNKRGFARHQMHDTSVWQHQKCDRLLIRLLMIDWTRKRQLCILDPIQNLICSCIFQSCMKTCIVLCSGRVFFITPLQFQYSRESFCRTLTLALHFFWFLLCRLFKWYTLSWQCLLMCLAACHTHKHGQTWPIVYVITYSPHWHSPWLW